MNKTHYPIFSIASISHGALIPAKYFHSRADNDLLSRYYEKYYANINSNIIIKIVTKQMRASF